MTGFVTQALLGARHLMMPLSRRCYSSLPSSRLPLHTMR